MSSLSQPAAVSTPLVLPATRAILWLVGTALFALAVYYFVGLEQGATSIFGSSSNVHEFVHDARHFIGFPCH